MVKTFILYILISIAVGAYGYFRIDYLSTQNQNLKSQKARCENEMAASIAAKERSEKTIGEIRTVVKTVRSVCDCYNSAIDEPIIKRVRGK